MAPKLHVIICSTRPGRIGPTIARWFNDYATSLEKFDVDLIDIADFNLPIYDEPVHPVQQNYKHDHTKAWAKSVNAADAFVFVTPEYNYFPPPSLVNALNFVYREWNYKPCAFVSYGGVSGGLRAVQTAKLLVTTLKMMPMAEGVMIPMAASKIDDSGVFQSNELIDKSAGALLNELHKWTVGLKAMRDAG
ncbi:NADPH-dependent FMN reductase [Pseudorhodobacter sp.]|uniref:NADPH-dependent FMN reductase n=1 Tax=Pseudorhodobacter sp. TaxID=1934400 RepID=UPI002647EA56|nr:NAD(P)H-dependent oxidoreductase [Pseudorhodobacter sp.]MDN5787075.1 NAD(P)H-dependent oxidoreductase [Pseudorhodobacter sp.]